jgi:serine/threonine-protein kinase
MVDGDGAVKIIDLGFGKQIRKTADFDKSISLNWWCDVPEEFNAAKYDFKTEVYFVGKLFDGLVQENDLQEFKYKEILGRMCQWRTAARLPSFIEVLKNLDNDRFYEIEFEHAELSAYRAFAEALGKHITKVAKDAKYIDDAERIKISLEAAYHGAMLEETVPDAVTITRAVLNGQYFYQKVGLPVKVVRNFLQLLKTVSIEKQRIILANLWTRLDAIDRYDPNKESFDDDIPF